MTTNKQIMTAGTVNVTVEIEIAATIAATWKAMTEDISRWWRKDYLICENSLGMNLDARPGGILFESTPGGGGFVWGQIISFQPENHFSYLAQIVPPWGGPAQSVVQIALEPHPDRPDRATKLTLTDSLIGHVTEDLVADLDQGWRQLYGEGGLKSYIESKGS